MLKMFAELFLMCRSILAAGSNIGLAAEKATGVLVDMADTYKLEQAIEIATKQAALAAKRKELGLD